MISMESLDVLDLEGIKVEIVETKESDSILYTMVLAWSSKLLTA